MTTQQKKIIEPSILDMIRNSTKIEESEKREFISLIMYFTPMEIEELRLII